MKDTFERFIRWADAWKKAEPAFTPAQLSANQRGELLPEQFPPFGWQLLGLCLLGLVLFLLARWGLRLRRERGPWIVAAPLSLVCLVPVWALGSSLSDALLDRFEARACAFTEVTSGYHLSPWGMGIRYLDVGHRTFRVLEGSLGREPLQDGRPYRAFFACHSETLASLEPAGDTFERPESTEYRAELGELFGFDDEDLAENRSGRISVRQYPIGQLASVLFFLVPIIAVGVTCLTVSDKPKWLAPCIGGLLLALGLAIMYAARSLFYDAVALRSCEAAGNVNLDITFSKGSPVWHLSVAGEVLTRWRSVQGRSLIHVGQPYRVYYLCHSKHLASIEPLEPSRGRDDSAARDDARP